MFPEMNNVVLLLIFWAAWIFRVIYVQMAGVLSLDSQDLDSVATLVQSI